MLVPYNISFNYTFTNAQAVYKIAKQYVEVVMNQQNNLYNKAQVGQKVLITGMEHVTDIAVKNNILHLWEMGLLCSSDITILQKTFGHITIDCNGTRYVIAEEVAKHLIIEPHSYAKK